MRPRVGSATDALAAMVVLAGPGDALAEAIVDALAGAPESVGPLRSLVEAPHPAQATVYTVNSLAAMTGLTPKSIRNAIGRGDMRAAKRAGRWMISADAVAEWSEPALARRFSRRVGRDGAKPLTNALSRFEREVSSLDVVRS